MKKSKTDEAMENILKVAFWKIALLTSETRRKGGTPDDMEEDVNSMVKSCRIELQSLTPTK